MKGGLTVKICGITNLHDAELVARAGADYIGVLVEVSYSPRSLSLEEAGAVFAGSPLPAVALVHGMGRERLAQVVRRLWPRALQFLSPVEKETARWLKELRPGLEIWQSIFLPAAGAGGGAAGRANEEEIGRQLSLLPAAGVDVVVFDAAAVRGGQMRLGGTGQAHDWEVAARLVRSSPLPTFLAGGLNPGNVAEAVRRVRPRGIDLCSGVEESTGKKSAAKLAALMSALRGGEVGVQ